MRVYTRVADTTVASRVPARASGLGVQDGGGAERRRGVTRGNDDVIGTRMP